MVYMSDEQLNHVWKGVLQELESSISRTVFKTWFEKSRLLSLKFDTAELGVDNQFAEKNIRKYAEERLVAAISREVGRPIIKVQYTVITSTTKKGPVNLSLEGVVPSMSAPILELITTNNEVPIRHNLNPRYSFDNFIIGDRNRLAWAAAKGVADRPGTAYNPLYLYGGVGLGKTHLMQAIGNEIISKTPQKRVLYVSCEQFTNEYVAAVQKGKTEQLKQKYRGVDVFLMDDIQFMAGKDGTQEEFFHTFNTLYQENKQIIMTSDKVPSDIKGLEERLASRFTQGMIADMQLPNLETRLAILQAKCEEKNITIEPDILLYIADRVESNIRELEGALTTVLLQIEAGGGSGMESVQAALKSFSSISKPLRKTSADQICSIVCEFYMIEVADVKGPRRQKELVKPRQIIMYLLKHEMGLTFPAIGRQLGGRDHTTAMHSVQKVEKDMKKSPELLEELQRIKELFYSGNK